MTPVTWWTPERIEQLCRMVEQGHSRGEIARVLGTSRNAVIGKAARMGLPDPRKGTGYLRCRQLAKLLEECDELERQCVEYFRREEAKAWRRNHSTLCADPQCWLTRQPGRTHCARHLPVPKRKAGWAGLGRASGTSSIV